MTPSGPDDKHNCLVAATDSDSEELALRVAQDWGLVLAAPEALPGLRLWVSADDVCLGDSRARAPGPVRVDFQEPALLRRLRQPGSTREPLLRAVGARRGVRPSIVDATAGLGRDGALLAASGCPVVLLERSAVVSALLTDGLRRAGADPRLERLCRRLTVVNQEARDVLSREGRERPDVIYLDPMYAADGSNARSGKAMQHLQALLGDDPDAGDLLALALGAAGRRVVVKRQRRAAALAGREPNFTCGGSSTRFDVYLCGQA
ncbi:MAG: class I SAM-dependent methyltransferase [Ectothiorhodospiraceae bacterium]